MLDFAVMLARFPEEVSEEDFETLHSHGFSDEDIWDIGSITGVYGLSNRIALLSALDPNPEYFNMGRDR
jgi:alkylhydroperoxidase family enzyme